MSDLQTPTNNQVFAERMLLFGQNIIAPHAVIVDAGQKRRAQLLNAVALIFMILLGVGVIAGYSVIVDFRYLIFVPLAAFILGKSKYPRAGIFTFSLAAASIAYLSLYFGYTRNYILTVLVIVPIALILINALTSQNIFAGFAIFATICAFLAESYSSTIIQTGDAGRIGSIILSTSIALYGVSIMRAALERSHRTELHTKEEELQKAISDFGNLSDTHHKETESANQQLQAQTARLRIIAEISQAISANINIPFNELLTYITEIISEKLGFYHVGIFLLDKNRQYAELQAANSQGGERMLDRHHQLKVGGTGIVGYVSQSGFPRIALSTGADAVFFNNPDLPETRSEMAIPLKIGNLVIGVLDVQSPLPAAFNEEDTNTFNTLANQIAFIIKNTQIGDQPNIQVERKATKHITGKDAQKGYTYFSDGTISSAKTINSPVLDKALNSSETIASPSSSSSALPVLAIPVKIRDSVIGYIHVEATDVNRKWTEDEIIMAQSVSERAALALENARLFEETEHRAEQEQIMAQMTSRIGESTSFERILQTTIQEIGRTLGARRTYIQMEPVSSNKDDAAADQGIQQ